MSVVVDAIRKDPDNYSDAFLGYVSLSLIIRRGSKVSTRCGRKESVLALRQNGPC